MSANTLLTVEQFEQMPEEDGVQYELKDGELVRMANAKAGHERTKFRIERSLMAYILQHPIGEIYSESSFALSPSRVCAPDVSFLRNELAVKDRPGSHFSGCAGPGHRSGIRKRERPGIAPEDPGLSRRRFQGCLDVLSQAASRRGLRPIEL